MPINNFSEQWMNEYNNESINLPCLAVQYLFYHFTSISVCRMWGVESKSLEGDFTYIYTFILG